MKKETLGTVGAVWAQWWLKVNTKIIRTHPMDGAAFPHLIRVDYTVAGQVYHKHKWIGAGKPVPTEGSTVTVYYCPDKPQKATIPDW